jgi:hypothetical protein
LVGYLTNNNVRISYVVVVFFFNRIKMRHLTYRGLLP